MSAPDVERLAKKAAEAFRVYRDRRGWDADTKAHDTLVSIIGEAINSALSSRPDSLSPQDDVAGRLAEALEDMLDLAVVSPGSTRKIQHADKVLKAYRANPSGWIPVGERLPDGHLWKIDVKLRDGSVLIGGERDLALVRWGGLFFRVDGPEIVAWRESEITPPPQDEHSGRIYTDTEEIDAAQRQMREGRKP